MSGLPQLYPLIGETLMESIGGAGSFAIDSDELLEEECESCIPFLKPPSPPVVTSNSFMPSNGINAEGIYNGPSPAVTGPPVSGPYSAPPTTSGHPCLPLVQVETCRPYFRLGFGRSVPRRPQGLHQPLGLDFGASSSSSPRGATPA
jgi:hypothetical protein